MSKISRCKRARPILKPFFSYLVSMETGISKTQSSQKVRLSGCCLWQLLTPHMIFFLTQKKQGAKNNNGAYLFNTNQFGDDL